MILYFKRIASQMKHLLKYNIINHFFLFQQFSFDFLKVYENMNNFFYKDIFVAIFFKILK
jgi:hypothetical protein